jgi:two-component system, NarL family, nitrate/nitrite response regulator NarL
MTSSKVETSIRVFVAGAKLMECQLLATALQRSRQRIEVVGFAVDAGGILEGLRLNSADIAVVGASLKDGKLSGFDTIRNLRNTFPQLRTIVLLDSAAPAMIVEAFRSGAHGILSRDEPFELLCKCIHAVFSGQIWANSKQLQVVVDALSKNVPPARIRNARGANLLTQREEGLVHLVAEGRTNRDISRHLNLSEHTVRNYLFRIFNKLGTSNRLELALYAIHRNDGNSTQVEANE